uniref:Placental growth factor n=1 Tax=Coturnix japonica TaxID=93934 RepID=A0A8C2U9B1_COTJA
RAAMRLLGAFLRLLLAGALGAVPRFLAVLTFKEIWNRSFCRPREQLVDIITEFPNEVEYIFRPSCVSLQRCGGCCGDEGLRCVPVQTSTVTVQLVKIKPNGEAPYAEAPYVEMSFTEHKQCESHLPALHGAGGRAGAFPILAVLGFAGAHSPRLCCVSAVRSA